jgi:hypothetical protein
MKLSGGGVFACELGVMGLLIVYMELFSGVQRQMCND